MNQFIRRELGTKPPAEQPAKRTWKGWLAVLGLSAIGGAVGFFSTYFLFKGVGEPGSAFMLWQLGGAFIAFLPIHEFIHGLAFKRIGAPKVGYGYSLKSLMVYAYSQNFPSTMREVALVAGMPFGVITTALIIGWILLPAYPVFWGFLLLIHTLGCIGDFALINYHRKNRHRTIYTYDDVEGERKTYFFEEVK